MKFLADQNVRFRAVLALRKAGYDILHTSEIGVGKGRRGEWKRGPIFS